MILEFICIAIYLLLFLLQHLPGNCNKKSWNKIKTMYGFIGINKTNTESYELTLLQMINTLTL